MLGSQNRNIKILGGLWLVLGGLAFARAISAIIQFKIEPSAAADWVDYFLGMLVVGSLHMVSGWALLRRNPLARPLLAISSFVLLVFYAGLVAAPPEYSGAGRTSQIGGVLPLLVLVVVFWLTLSGRGKEALKSYVARNNGLRG